MAYTDFIAAIDLGSSHMVGMVGAKGPAGTLSIIAYEVENSDTCIRRGCVYNIKDAAGKIVRLIRKLENKLGGSRIGKIYVGVGGQSLRSINHAVSKVLGSGTVTEEVLKELDQECRQYRPDMLDVLDIAAPVYYLDNQPETHPVGLGCSRIEAHYKLLVGRPSLRHAVTTNMAEQIKLDVAGVVVAPLALADLDPDGTREIEGVCVDRLRCRRHLCHGVQGWQSGRSLRYSVGQPSDHSRLDVLGYAGEGSGTCQAHLR